MATPGAPSVLVVTLATSCMPWSGVYGQICPLSAAIQTVSPSVSESGDKLSATPESPTSPG